MCTWAGAVDCIMSGPTVVPAPQACNYTNVDYRAAWGSEKVAAVGVMPAAVKNDKGVLDLSSSATDKTQNKRCVARGEGTTCVILWT